MSSPTMFHDLESPPGGSQQDERALQIALELSNLGLLGTGDDDSSTSSYDEITKSKKSQNMTECVPVPSSEHVAEIVGRQGCKIKALRAKTSTYIKTPVRGEEPVFVVTGRKEDVAMARREIQSAAEHFTQIRATRNKAGIQGANVPPLSGLAYPLPISSGSTSPTDLASPGTITLQVRVPYRVVGLVVGPKGATIKRIQQQTHTYIVTPSRDKEPVFEVTGLPENVEKAKEEIEAHIAARTGSQNRDIDDDFASNGTVVGSPASFNRSQSAFTPYRSNAFLGQTRQDITDPSFRFALSQMDNPFFSQLSGYSKYQAVQNQQSSVLDLTHSAALNMYSHNGRSALDQYDPSLAASTIGFEAPAPITTTSWPLGDLNDIASFPMFSAVSENSPSNSSLTQQGSLSGSMLPSRLSPTFSESDFPLGPLATPSSMQSSLSSMARPPMRRVGSDSVDSTGSSIEFHAMTSKPISTGISSESGYSSGGTDSQTSGSPVENLCGMPNVRTASPSRICYLCHETSVTTALVPCGHNIFCYECADKALKSSALCPCCNETATMALRIKTEPAA